MSLTGTYSFDPQLAELLDEAFERAGVDPAAPGQNMIAAARRSLRFMLSSEWSTFGFNQWQVHQGTETMTVGKADFYLPPGGIDIWDVVLRRAGRDTEMYLISRDEYLVLTDKTKQGRPSRLYLDKQTGRPRAFFWECGVNVTDIIVYNYLRQMQDATGHSPSLKTTLDMPVTSLECAVAGLAWRMAQKFNQPREQQLRAYYGGPNYPEKLGGTIELMRQANRDRADLDLYSAYEPRTTRR